MRAHLDELPRRRRGAFGAALRATGGDRQKALALMGIGRQQGVLDKVDRNKSPVLQDGQQLPWVDMSSLDADQLGKLARMGVPPSKSNLRMIDLLIGEAQKNGK